MEVLGGHSDLDAATVREPACRARRNIFDGDHGRVGGNDRLWTRDLLVNAGLHCRRSEAARGASVGQPGVHYRPWIVIAQPALRRFIASGPIGDGSARVLADAIKAHPGLRLLELDSPGGLFVEAEQVVTLVRKHKLDTVVLDKCASACTSIFLAGERRYITWNARFGFHQSGYYGRKHDTVWATEEYETAIYFRERGVSEAFLQTALNTSHYGIWRPDPLDVNRNGFANAWRIERPGEYR